MKKIYLALILSLSLCLPVYAKDTGWYGTTAADVRTDTINFDGILSSLDDTVQAALETLDELVFGTGNANYSFGANNFNGTGRFNTTNNITAANFFGNINWSYIQNAPTYENYTEPRFAASFANESTDNLTQGSTNKYANTTKEDNGQTAFGWGNHASVGYALQSNLSVYYTAAQALAVQNYTYYPNWTQANSTYAPITITQYTDALARGAISETVTGLDYASATGVLSQTSGYVIPTTTEESNWNGVYANNHSIMTLAGHPYLSLSGQQVTANDVALGGNTSGNYVGSVATSAPLTGGAAGSEGATLTLGFDTTNYKRHIGFTITNGTNAITTGWYGIVRATNNFTASGWKIFSSDFTKGNITVAVKKFSPPAGASQNFTEANFTLCSGTENVTLSGVCQFSEDTSLGSFNTTIVAGEYYGFNVTSADTVKQVNIVIYE